MRADIAEILPDNPIVAAASARGVSHWIKKLIVKEYLNLTRFDGHPDYARCYARA
jgi:hypothetical protein